MTQDLTLDEMRLALAPRIPAHAGFDGWTAAALDRAADEIGVPPAQAALVFPGGAIEMIDAWFGWVDGEMAVALPAETLAAMPIRARITALVRSRIEIVARSKDALTRAMPILALPRNAGRAARLGWRAADAMWRLAGDTATDLNHYSKRLTLGAVYASTLLAFLDDDSEDHAETWAFLDRRIAGVMRFEKLKAQFRPQPDRHFNVARFLGRLRYPAT